MEPIIFLLLSGAVLFGEVYDNPKNMTPKNIKPWQQTEGTVPVYHTDKRDTMVVHPKGSSLLQANERKINNVQLKSSSEKLLGPGAKNRKPWK